MNIGWVIFVGIWLVMMIMWAIYFFRKEYLTAIKFAMVGLVSALVSLVFILVDFLK